jgi:UDP-N-acetylmuramoyl-L-alanyl-D-glutamate--2,6-diaminopimelate ligase
MERALRDCVAGLSLLESSGPADALIAGLAYDSRAVRRGFMFFALPGLHADGHRFIDAAIDRGAVAVLHSQPLSELRPGISYLRVEDPRAAMSPVADSFYSHPCRDLCVIGVTGTEGKSTTVYLIYQLLELVGKRAGFFSTVMSRTSGEEMPNPEHQTTPEAPSVMRMLAEMRDAGLEYAVVEASSHGLSERTNRLGDVAFDVGIMTNVTHEHLEFHGTWERYRFDKARLFRALDPAGRESGDGSGRRHPAFGIVNAEDPSAEWFAAQTRAHVYAFSAGGSVLYRKPDLRVSDVREDARGVSFAIEGSSPIGAASAGPFPRCLPARINLPGSFNVGNALAALIAVAGLTGMDWPELIPFLPSLKPVQGRMTAIREGQDFELLVDYAHTPSSFAAIFPPLRARIGGRILSVFGSGGERDRDKRPEQGRIASLYSDIVILADEDPRGEDPMEILKEIAAGCAGKTEGKDLFLVPERPAAIRKAFGFARSEDLVLLLGKGHENSIIRADGSHPYDEEGEARSALAELGLSNKPALS